MEETAPLILNLSIREKCVASFMLRPLKSQYPSYKRVGGPRSQSGHYPKVTHRNILFNHTVNCQDNTSKVVNEINMRMELWSNVTDKGKPQYSEKTPTQGHFLHQKSHTVWPRIEPGHLSWETSD